MYEDFRIGQPDNDGIEALTMNRQDKLNRRTACKRVESEAIRLDRRACIDASTKQGN